MIDSKYIILAGVAISAIILYYIYSSFSSMQRTILTTYHKGMNMEKRITELEREMAQLHKADVDEGPGQQHPMTVTYYSDMNTNVGPNRLTAMDDLNDSEVNEIKQKLSNNSDTHNLRSPGRPSPSRPSPSRPSPSRHSESVILASRSNSPRMQSPRPLMMAEIKLSSPHRSAQSQTQTQSDHLVKSIGPASAKNSPYRGACIESRSVDKKEKNPFDNLYDGLCTDQINMIPSDDLDTMFNPKVANEIREGMYSSN